MSDSRENMNVPFLPDSDPEKKRCLDRYRVASRWVTGSVLDICCGWGYGTAMLRAVDGVTDAIGVDRDAEALAYAKTAYSDCSFEQADVEQEWRLGATTFDTVVTIETIEHLRDPETFRARVERAATQRIILSTPIVPSKHVNEFHFQDFTEEQIKGWFPEWSLVHYEDQDAIYGIAVWSRHTNS